MGGSSNILAVEEKDAEKEGKEVELDLELLQSTTALSRLAPKLPSFRRDNTKKGSGLSQPLLASDMSTGLSMNSTLSYFFLMRWGIIHKLIIFKKK